MSRSSRAGFTVVEAAVAIAIVATLMAILLPAVGAVRETSRKTECTSKIGDVGKAFQGFEAQHQKLPGLGWRLKLLPHVGQQPLWNAANALSSFEEAMPLYVGARIDVYVCPSDGADVANTNGSWGANYVACHAGSPFGSGPGLSVGAREDGMIPVWIDPLPTDPNVSRRNRGRRLSEVVDGLSNTAMLSELRRSDGSGARLRNVWFLPPAFPELPLTEILSHCERLPIVPSEAGYIGDNFGLGTPWWMCDWGRGVYNHVLPPNRPSCHPSHSNRLSVYTASSQHPGGAHVAWGDGHVSFEAQAVDRQVWLLAGGIDDLLRNNP